MIGIGIGIGIVIGIVLGIGIARTCFVKLRQRSLTSPEACTSDSR